MLKETDAEAARVNVDFPPFDAQHPSKFHLDTINLERQASAREILRWLQAAPNIAIP